MAGLYITEYTPSALSCLLLALPFLLTYTITSFKAWQRIRSKDLGKSTPVAPYWVPVLGHAFSFLWDTANLGRLTRSHTDQPTPVRVKLFNQELNFVTGSDDIIAVWRSKILEAREVTRFSLRTFFNSPEKSMKIYETDDSGINPRPHPKSNVAPHHRYYFQTRKHTVGFFNSPGLKHMAYRFQDLLKARLRQTSIGEGWTEFGDLYAFVQDVLTGPAVEAMCGPRMLRPELEFIDRFWTLDEDIILFFKGCPRWLCRRAWRNREKLLDGVKEWHAWARKNFDESGIEADGHDKFYGSPLMRTRQEYLSKTDLLDADALASQDLGLIWAENANSIPAVFWLLLELHHQPSVLRKARQDVFKSQSPASSPQDPHMDIDELCSKPLLQSIYTETLRLYTSLFALRSSVHEDFHLREWRIPTENMIAVDSRVAHMDKTLWNTGPTSRDEGPHPLTQFWATRFLEYGDDPTSGPLRSKLPKPKATAADGAAAGRSEGQFTMEGLSGGWLPFGGGSRQCPGRNFAKQEIILSFAVITTMFDIELLDEERRGPLLPNMKYYGLGTFAPKVKVPFRIKLRKEEDE